MTAGSSRSVRSRRTRAHTSSCMTTSPRRLYI
nr:MAG TPA: hypothetical protein [Caudoviricetes sp.]DAM31206.1 MAG TPA: hypothetical protein [Caudoviricetes sp.]DAN32493.1 MAG TPA: hypothetical protein [Caudoviricetes sp.]DAN38955.1 MAG TPA: hypothetical protein [Caudoviricetes sp.]DAR12323.1 MAG TPA: hypothetical protein [Caudoviricetes sp.]